MKYLFVLFLFFVGVVPASAQDKSPEYQERFALATKMHEIRPAREQVEAAVNQVSLSLPQGDRETFKSEILAGFDFDRLDVLSVESMAELFTVGELTAMIDYFGSDEAKSISEKFPVYEEMVQPEIMKMLDAALMNLRAGK